MYDNYNYMIKLGIDQSFTSTGWAITSNAQLIAFGTIKSDKSLDAYQRAYMIAEEVSLICDSHNPDEIHIEGLAFGMRGNATRDLAMLYGSITAVAMLRHAGVPIITHPPTQVKKFATGSGTSDKTQMYDALPDDVRIQIESIKKTHGRYDVTDAYWISRCGT